MLYKIRFYYFLFLFIFTPLIANPISAARDVLSQNDFPVNDAYFLYRGVRYDMKEVMDGEFEIDLGCRIDTGAVDIVFIIDNTGSMGSTISGVRSNINNFITQLDSRGYDYRLGGVEYGDLVGPSGSRRAYDSTAALAGLQMTSDYWGSFQPWVNGISAWGGADSPENALCAIEAGMNNYDWRPDALHILIFFTDACFYQCGDWSCDGTCSYCATDVYNDIIGGGFVLFAQTNTSPYCSGCASIGSAGAYNWYHNTATSSGGNWYSLGTSWSTIFDDVVALIDTFEVINFCVTNNTGSTISTGTATVVAGGCISVLSANPQTYGPWYNGEEHCFVWRINTTPGCTGPDGCFDAIIAGGGYADTITGCVFLEDCACPGPEATPLCPPCGGTGVTYTACDDQQITIQLTDDDSNVNTSTISMVVDGVTYNFPDHMSFAGDVLTWTPDVPWTNGQIVEYQIISAEDMNGCPLLNTFHCGFVVDLRPPDIITIDPACYTEIGDTILNVSIGIADSLSGIDILGIYFTVNGTPYYMGGGNVSYTGDYTYGTAILNGTFSELGISDVGTVEVCIYAADRVPSTESGCDLCGPNDTLFCCEYYTDTPPYAYFFAPDSASIVACDPAEILLAYHDDEGDPLDSMSLVLQVWSSSYAVISYSITSDWFNMLDETTAVFTPDPGYFPSGDTIWAQLIAGADIYGHSISNLPIGWMFVLDYEPPVYFNHYPPPDTIMHDFPESAFVEIFDSISGLDYSSLQITVNGVPYSDWMWTILSDSTCSLSINLSDDICLGAGETCAVEICVYSYDSPDTCGPNDTTDCWTFYWVHGQPWVEIQFPDPYSIVACQDSTVEIVLHGAVGPIDSSTIVLVIDNGETSDTFQIFHPWLYVEYGDSDTVLVFSPPLGYWETHDTITVTLVDARDIYGTSASDLPLVWVFYTDFTPPTTWSHFPPDSGTMATSAPTISFDITDSVAGLDTSLFFVTITDTCGTLHYVDTFAIGDAGVVWDPTHFEIISTIAGYEFEDGDTVWVCVESMVDTPTFCGPNDTTNCWWFIVSLSGPVGEIITYEPGAWVACDSLEQEIQLTVTDPDGVIPDSIILQVEDSIFTYAEYESTGAMTYYNDTLVFIPLDAGVVWHDAEIIDVCLLDAVDSLGNHMAHSLCWSFIMDLSNPNVWGPVPPPDTIFNNDTALISIYVYDSLSGVNDSTLIFIINGDTLHIWDDGMNWDPGESLLTFDITALGSTWNDFDTVNVCVYAEDSPDYCPPNDTLFCWTFEVHLTGPFAEIITPQPGEITACEDQCIILTLTDDDTLVDPSTIQLVVVSSGINDTFDLTDPQLVWEPDTLMFCPDDSTGFWVNNESVYVAIISATDMLGNELENPTEWAFWVDLEPPLVYDFDPVCYDTISTGRPNISFSMSDNLSGVNAYLTIITIDDTVVLSIDDSSVTVDGFHVIVNTGLAGLRWSGGDSVSVCVSVFDSPDLCIPNDSVYCCVFYIAPGGPYPSIVRPFDGAWSSCDDEHIVFTLEDGDGVVDTSIQFSVVRSSDVADTIRLLYDSPGVTLTGDSTYYTVEYYPTPAFFDAETIWVCIDYSADYLDNVMSPIPLCWEFYMDLEPPYVFDASPSYGAVVPDHTPEIRFHLDDVGSGLDSSTIVFTVNGTEYSTFDDGSGYFVWDAESVGVEFSGGDVIEVCVHATDSTDYCGDNVLDTCWAFSIEAGGPVADARRAFGYSSCMTEYVAIWLYDSSGVDETTIVLVVNDDTLHWGAPGLSYIEDDTMLYYVPSPAWPDSAHIVVTLLECSDIYGNPMETPVTWDFIIDRENPVIWSIVPSPGSTVGEIAPIISFNIEDGIAGLALDSLILTVDGVEYTLSSTGITFDTTTGLLTFDPSSIGLYWTGGDVVNICLDVFDLADDYYGIGDWTGGDCPPNELDTCWSFTIMPGEPYAVIHRRAEWTYFACDPDSIAMVVVDTSGVIADSIRIVVGRYGCSDIETLRVGDAAATEIAHITEYPDSVAFWYVPSPTFVNAETVCISVITAYDSLFNPMMTIATDTFIVDLTPPVVLSQTPSPGEIVSTSTPEICVEIYDSLSGVDDASVNLIVDGVSYTSSSAGFSWDGSQACLDPIAAGIEWFGGDTVSVCITADDSPDTCGPNMLDSCWFFTIATGGPVAEITHPEPLIYSACEDESVAIYLYDPQGDNIIDSTITVRVVRNGSDTIIVSVGSSGQLRWDEASGTLIFNPLPPFLDGDTIEACVIAAMDTLENPLESVVCVEFFMDLSPYVAYNFVPADSDTVYTRVPLISVVAVDSITGIADSSIVLTVDGVPYTLNSPALYWQDETTLVFVPESLGVRWTGGDWVNVSLYAYDQPTPGYCVPNDSTVNWGFLIAPGGPVGTIVRPFDGAFSSCEDEHIIMLVEDSDGVNASTIVLEVNGVAYTIDDPELSYSNDTLYYYPSPPFENGDIINVRLVAADDILGNALEDTVEWNFVMDMTDPWSVMDEPTDIMVRDREQDIEITIGDSISGVDISSIAISINGVRYSLDQLLWDSDEEIQGGKITFKPEEFGLSFPSGETVWVDVYAVDQIDYCDDNDMHSIYWFFIEPEVPCYVHPNPFTPNGDNVNEIAVFDYPYMFSEEAKLMIFDLRNVLVYERELRNITSFSDFDARDWDGTDNSGNKVPEGLYIWMIVKGGEVICNGTVAVAR